MTARRELLACFSQRLAALQRRWVSGSLLPWHAHTAYGKNTFMTPQNIHTPKMFLPHRKAKGSGAWGAPSVSRTQGLPELGQALFPNRGRVGCRRREERWGGQRGRRAGQGRSCA